MSEDKTIVTQRWNTSSTEKNANMRKVKANHLGNPNIKSRSYFTANNNNNNIVNGRHSP